MREPVVPTPAQRSVSEVIEIVCELALVLMSTMVVAVGKAVVPFAGMAQPPVVLGTALPASVSTRVYAPVWLLNGVPRKPGDDAPMVPVSLIVVPALMVLPVVRVLFVTFCVSVVPTKSPAGLVLTVNADVPLPMTTPVSVVAPVPPLATGSVPVTWVERLTPDNVPPRVSDPEAVTVPVRVMPLTVPVPETDVTVPTPVPTPIAVRKSAAVSEDTVLSALKRGKVIAPGLAMVKRLPPSVVAPRAVRAPEAVVEPVPPEAIGSAVPSVSEDR